VTDVKEKKWLNGRLSEEGKGKGTKGGGKKGRREEGKRRM